MRVNNGNQPRILLSALALTMLCFSAPLNAADDDGACSNATLKGDYGLYATGVRHSRDVPGLIESHATLAWRTYDGKGGFKGIGVASNGQFGGVTQGTPTSGSYQVSPDCSGTVTITIPGLSVVIRSVFIILDGGREIQEIPITAGEIGIATLHKK